METFSEPFLVFFKINKDREDPRLKLECRSRQCELHKSNLLLRCWKPHMAEINHQKVSKLQHPEAPAHTNLLHTTLHWENRRAPTLPDAGSKPSWETSGRTTGVLQPSHGIPIATPGINQHSPLDRQSPTLQIKKIIINKELKRTQQREWGAVSAPEGGQGKELISVQTFSKQRLERQKGWLQVGDKLLPEIGQIAVHKAHLLSQWATSKVKRCCKMEKPSANHHNTLTAGSHDRSLTLPQRKRVRQRNRPPINQTVKTQLQSRMASGLQS
jgi:hypothetical protein